MGRIVPEAMLGNRRWRIAIPRSLWAHVPHGSRYVQAADGNLVAPWSARTDAIGLIDRGAAERAAQARLCSACGTGIAWNETAVFLKDTFDLQSILEAADDGERVHHGEPPLHLACAGYAARACPRIREEKWSAILATKWDSGTECRDDDNRPEFWPDMKAKHEILEYDEFLGRTRITREGGHDGPNRP